MTAARSRAPMQGAATVEFALVLIFVFMLLFAVIEVGRLVWTWNVAVTATREGARVAAMCDIPDDPARDAARAFVQQRVERVSLGAISAADVEVEYVDPDAPGGNCTADNCKSVRVYLRGATFTSVVSMVPLSATLPSFTATARREAMVAVCN